MTLLPRTKSCFVCGRDNPLGLQLQFHTDGQRVHTRFRPRQEHVGFRATMHGGLIATLLDEVMTWICGVRAGRFAYCAELTVRFLAPVRPGEEVDVVAELVANKKNRLFEAKAEFRNAAGTVLASATGKYLPISPEVVRPMLGDFVGDLGLLGLGGETGTSAGPTAVAPSSAAGMGAS